MDKKLIAQGAEAKIYLVSSSEDFSQSHLDSGRQHANTDDREKVGTLISSKESVPPFILKSRISKTYRHPKLDIQIRKSRSKSEAKILTKALDAGVNVPKVLNKSDYELQIEFIAGDKLSEKLNSYPEKMQFEIMQKLGEQTAKLHDADIIHGDLTTSNTILEEQVALSQISRAGGKHANTDNREKVESKVFIIDFGLGFFSKKIEDKAVDLHLIKQALEAKHYQNYESLFKSFIKGYKSKQKKEILERLEKVEKRGRYKH